MPFCLLVGLHGGDVLLFPKHGGAERRPPPRGKLEGTSLVGTEPFAVWQSQQGLVPQVPNGKFTVSFPLTEGTYRIN